MNRRNFVSKALASLAGLVAAPFVAKAITSPVDGLAKADATFAVSSKDLAAALSRTGEAGKASAESVATLTKAVETFNQTPLPKEICILRYSLSVTRPLEGENLEEANRRLAKTEDMHFHMGCSSMEDAMHRNIVVTASLLAADYAERHGLSSLEHSTLLNRLIERYT